MQTVKGDRRFNYRGEIGQIRHLALLWQASENDMIGLFSFYAWPIFIGK
jgi:hypothetical protein